MQTNLILLPDGQSIVESEEHVEMTNAIPERQRAGYIATYTSL